MSVSTKHLTVCVILLSIVLVHQFSAIGCSIQIPINSELANADNPGVKAYVPVSSLNYALRQLMPIIHQQLSQISIGDQSGSIGTPIGKISYQISNIKLSNFNLQTPTIGITGADELTITINSASAHGSMNWNYREDSWPHVKDHGSADVDITLTAALKAALDIDHSQKSGLRFTVHGFTISITNFHLTVHGGASWLYNILLSIFEGQIKGSIQDALRSQIPSVLASEIQKQLNTIDTQVPIGFKGYDIFINFDPRRVFFNQTAQYISVGTAGEFIKKGIAPFPGEPGPIPDYAPGQKQSMIQMFLSDFVVNTASYVFDMAGVMEYTLRYSDVPPSIPFKLNTKTFEVMIPNLYKLYPDMNMNIAFAPNTPPTAHCNPQIGCQINADALSTFQVVQNDNTTTIDVFVLELQLILDLKADIKDLVISGTISYENATISLKSSKVGSFDTSLLQTTIQLTVQYAVLPIVNAIAQQGFPIPSVTGLTLSNSKLDYQQGYIGVYSDFTFNPQIDKMI